MRGEIAKSIFEVKSQYFESQRIPHTALQETSLKRHFWGKGPCWFWRLVTLKNLRLNIYSIMKSLVQCKIALTKECIFLSITSQVGHHCTKLFNFYTTRRWHMYIHRTNIAKGKKASKSCSIFIKAWFGWGQEIHKNLKNRCNSSGKSMYRFWQVHT